MGRFYSASFEDVAVSAAQDLFELEPGTDKPVMVTEIHIGQSSDYGNDEAEGLLINLVRYASGTASPGSSPTPRPHDVGDSAAACTVHANSTTQGTTPTVLQSKVFNIQIGFDWQALTPDERIRVAPGDFFAVELPNAPTDALTMSGTIVFEEI